MCACWCVYVNVGACILSFCTYVLAFALILVNAYLCILIDAFIFQASCVNSANECMRGC